MGIVQFYEHMQSNKDIMKGWRRAGVSVALEEAQRKGGFFLIKYLLLILC
jgi:hypothetical protein